MSSQQPFRSIIVNLATPARRCLRRQFHAGTPLRARPSPKHKSVKAEDMGLVSQKERQPKDVKTVEAEIQRLPPIDADQLANPDTLKPYSEAEKKLLQKVYTPEQIASIEAGEEAIDPKDLEDQAIMREDTMGLRYFDDLSTIHPVVDKPIRAPEENYDTNMRFKSEDELVDDYVKFFENSSEEPSMLEWQKFQDSQRLTVGKEEAERNPRSSLAPELPKIESLAKTVVSEDIEPAVQRLMRQTGYTSQQIARFRTKMLVDHRVVNQTRMGKQQRQYYLCIAGNGRGLLGIGEGKSAEPQDAKRMATLAAIRNMVPIPRYEERTIFGDVKGKVAGTEVELMSRTPGFGIRCQQYIYEMCKCAGLSDMAARVYRSRNPMNTVKATMQALLSQQIPEDVARARGRKLVDVRKVYYAGNV
ncbi:37S ribosomal protein S5 [Physcia stellaris]|nr:37S ribosomal protein S5 [Physcia stellaris]